MRRQSTGKCGELKRKPPAGLMAFEIVLLLGAMLPLAVLVFVLLARLARWFYFLVVHGAGGALF
jgi:hypothetical protein